jgi:uracil-DNA glycosylase
VSATPYLPEKLSLKALREAAAHCHGCDLYKRATQTVFGEGRARASVMFVGEQPGDAEDKQGHPFVGPAGKLLHRAMLEAGFSERDVYITNAVKHFKWIARGKRRIHQKPKSIEIQACRPWLEAEIKTVRPRVIVALGAVAAQALIGSGFKLLANRGRTVASTLVPSTPIVATVHPSSILRAPDDDTRHAEMARFVEDLRTVQSVLSNL